MPPHKSPNFPVMSHSDVREIRLSRGSTESSVFVSNKVTTGKYSLSTLLPKNLLEQFKRLANVWFLAVSVLQLLPLQLSPTVSWITIAPLALVLSVTLVKDAYIDFRRHQSDNEANSRLVSRWSESLSRFESVRWENVSVGNLLLLLSGPVPADLIILATSESDGICHIDTANLDGESNLKVKSALSDTAKIFLSEEMTDFQREVRKLDDGVVYLEKPNNRLYHFDGFIRLKEHIRAIPVDNQNVLLRGCNVTRTRWVIGLVVFTGEETKLMLNSTALPHKRSNVEKRVNKYLFFVFGFLLLLAVLSTLVSVIETYESPESLQWFRGENKAVSGLNFITFLILYNGLVPISLYVTIDVIRIIQTKFIQWDLRLYRAETDHPAIAKTADLNEDLGQIEYIFTDKTGTLTENRMMFKFCSIKGKVYGLTDMETGWNLGCVNPHPRFRFSDPNLIADSANGDEDVKSFLEILALCHTVSPGETSPEVSYQATSPDEEALVLAAHCFGFSYLSNRDGIRILQINGELHEYRVLGINEFSPSRKRMSIVLKPLNDSSRPAVLFCKGADSVILNLCFIENSAQVRTVNQHLFDFSMKGLRTLVLAKKELSETEADDYERKWISAKNAIAEREKRLEALAEDIEVEMDLIGITAVEDKIQDGVPEAISAFKEAGIKVWVLTGDKQETAINIGFSSRLLTSEMTVILINSVDLNDVKSKLMYFIGRFVFSDPEDGQIRRVYSNFSQPSNTPVSPFMNESPRIHPYPLRTSKTVGETSNVDLDALNIGLVVSGESLSLILNDPLCAKWFTILACISKAVICCRVSPMQKADIVRIVKEHVPYDPLTLAIGDGANDISMLQEAHIGVGIIGNEGMQAVNSSDYALGRFKYLLPLLFVHGRWNYHRVTKVILYSFYKNFLLILPMFYYSFLNFYSGTALYDSWLIMTYNVLFTSLPIIVLGTMETDAVPEEILSSPSMYKTGISGAYFNWKIFTRWILMAIAHSLLILVLVVFPSTNYQSPYGQMESFNSTGTIAYHAVVQAATYVVFLMMKSWTLLFVAVSAGSMLFFYVFIFFYDFVEFPGREMVGTAEALFTFPSHLIVMWMTPVLMAALAVLECFVRIYFQKSEKIHPSLSYRIGIPKSHVLHAVKLREIVSFDHMHLHSTPKGEEGDFSRARYRLVFQDSHLERTYQRMQVLRRLQFMKLMFWLTLGFLVIWTIADMSTTDRGTPYTALRISALVIMFLFCLFAHTPYFINSYESVILTVIICGMVLLIASDLLLNNDGAMSTAIVPIITFVLFNVSSYKLILLNSFFFLAYMVKLAVSMGEKDGFYMKFGVVFSSYFVLLSGIMIVTGYVGYVLEKENRDAFIVQKKLDAEVKRGQDILGNLLPMFVKDRVINGERDIAEDQGILTILFCDICDFDDICADKNLDLIKFLDNYFLQLDSLVDLHGLTKIETVNKTYMACGGLSAHERNLPLNLTEKPPAERVCLLAFDILKQLENVTLNSDMKLSVKIGIHTGQTYSGVVGLHKPQFSLIGDTVNYASRMCAFGQKDKVQISMETFKCVKDLPWVFQTSRAKIKEGVVDTMLIELWNKDDGIQARVSTPKSAYFNPQQVLIEPAKSLEGKNVLPVESKHTLDTSQAPLIQRETQLRNLRETTFIDNAFRKGQLKSIEKVEILPSSGLETEIQRKYRLSYVEQHMKSIVNCLWLTILVSLFDNSIFLSAFIASKETYGSPLLLALRLLCVLGLLALLFLFPRCAKSRSVHWGIIGLYAGCSLISVLTLYTINEDYIYIIVLEVMYINVIYSHVSGIAFKYLFIGYFFLLTPWVCISYTEGMTTFNSTETTFFIVFFMVLNAAKSYIRELQSRRTFALNVRQAEERTRTEDLLTKMMPKRVYNLLQAETCAAGSDSYDKTTVLYADICGFTIWAKNKSPKEVVGMLSRLYNAFDKRTLQHQVYKVHTIGDCYVILGLSDYQDNDKRDHNAECVHVVEMAMDMIREIKKINEEVANLDIGMRIGIHTGKVIGAFAGKIVVRYDIYGPAVTKANKMESGGMKNNINVSEKTRLILMEACPDRFQFIQNKKEIIYEPKNKAIPAYFLDPTKKADFF